MRRHMIFLVLVICSCEPLLAQRFISDPSDERYAAVFKVYDRIVRAIQMPGVPPTLLLYEGKRYGAQTFPDRRIVVDTRLYELTRELGAHADNALAFVIGHELHHYFGQDFFCFTLSCAEEFVGTELGTVLRRKDAVRNTDERVLSESRADAIGALYAYQGGYDADAAAEPILRKIYDAYDPDTSGYPPFEQRVVLVKSTLDRIEGTYPLFDAANRWLLLGKYEAAHEAFERLLQEFPCREMYNNSGVALALSALGLMPEPPQLLFPFELDAELRTRRSDRGRGGDDGPEKRLRAAIASFEEASRVDTGYITPRINLACALALLERGGSMYGALAAGESAYSMAVRSGSAQTIASAAVAFGIVYILRGDSVKGRELFARALEVDAASTFARANMDFVRTNGSGSNAEGCREIPKVKLEERIADIGRSSTSRMLTERLYPGSSTRWACLEKDGVWQARHERAGGEDEELTVVCTDPGYSGRSARGIGIGSTLDEVRAAYGCTRDVRRLHGGEYHLYTGTGIAFRLEADGTVGEWFIWW